MPKETVVKKHHARCQAPSGFVCSCETYSAIDTFSKLILLSTIAFLIILYCVLSSLDAKYDAGKMRSALVLGNFDMSDVVMEKNSFVGLGTPIPKGFGTLHVHGDICDVESDGLCFNIPPGTKNFSVEGGIAMADGKRVYPVKVTK